MIECTSCSTAVCCSSMLQTQSIEAGLCAAPSEAWRVLSKLELQDATRQLVANLEGSKAVRGALEAGGGKVGVGGRPPARSTACARRRAG